METTARGDVPKTLQTIAYISIPDNAATPQLVMALTCLVQTNGGPTRLFSALSCGSDHGIDTLSRTAKALKRLLDSSQRLIVSHIFNG